MKKNILISTGGSGGHVVPATILLDHLTKSMNVFITTDKRGLRYLDKKILQYEIIDTPKLNNIFFLPINFFIILFLILKSFIFLKQKKIDKVFSTGGYMSLPLVLAANLLNLEIYLLEPNHILGRANKFFLNYSKKIFCYTQKIKNFPDDFTNKIVSINPLVKQKTYNLISSNIKKKKFTLLVVGGSQGAEIFDKNLKNSIVNISKIMPIRVIQQTNEKNISFLTDFYTKNNIENKIFSYDKNFINMIIQSDLCITRAGASTLAELSLINLPFIAVPLPSSKDNHQLENANFYEGKNCCWVVEQKNFEENIEKLLKTIFLDKKEYLEKKQNLKKLNFKNTWIDVNKKILGTLNEN